MTRKKKAPVVTLNINEGWDIRGMDRKLHYFVRNRAVCSHRIRYHPPYFDAGFIPEPDDIEIKDHCVKCLRLMRNRFSHLSLKKFFQ